MLAVADGKQSCGWEDVGNKVQHIYNRVVQGPVSQGGKDGEPVCFLKRPSISVLGEVDRTVNLGSCPRLLKQTRHYLTLLFFMLQATTAKTLFPISLHFWKLWVLRDSTVVWSCMSQPAPLNHTWITLQIRLQIHQSWIWNHCLLWAEAWYLFRCYGSMQRIWLNCQGHSSEPTFDRIQIKFELDCVSIYVQVHVYPLAIGQKSMCIWAIFQREVRISRGLTQCGYWKFSECRG